MCLYCVSLSRIMLWKTMNTNKVHVIHPIVAPTILNIDYLIKCKSLIEWLFLVRWFRKFYDNSLNCFTTCDVMRYILSHPRKWAELNSPMRNYAYLHLMGTKVSNLINEYHDKRLRNTEYWFFFLQKHLRLLHKIFQKKTFIKCEPFEDARI